MRIKAILLLTLLVSTGPVPCRAAQAEPEGSGVVQKVEHAVERGAEAAADGVERGARAAARGVKRAAGATARGVRAGASGVARGANAAARGVQTAANKVKGTGASSGS